MNIRQLVERMIQDASFTQIVNNPVSQFGTVAAPLLGAEILPERNVPENAYVEEAIRYRSVIANDGTRYSPVQIKEGIMTGVMQVVLGNSDIGSQFTGAQYDALIRILRAFNGNTTPTMEQVSGLINWVDTTLSMPLRMKNELQRWQAIVDAQIVRAGDGGYRETVNYPNPAGHRGTAGGTWSNDAYDPWVEIMAKAEFLRSLGYTVNRIFCGTPVESKLANNAKIRARGGVVSIISGTVVGLPGRLSRESLNNLLRQEGLPAIEIYDGQYRTQTGSGYYLSRTAFVLVATTGRDETVLGVDNVPLIQENTLGYTAIGRAAGQSEPGRAIDVEAFTNKPPRLNGEAWQTSLPVILEPDAIVVIEDIA